MKPGAKLSCIGSTITTRMTSRSVIAAAMGTPGGESQGNMTHSLASFGHRTVSNFDRGIATIRTGCVTAMIHPNEDDDFAVGRDPATASELLQRLAQSAYWTVRSAVAGNPSAPDTTLVQLAYDEEWYVRANVAINAAASPEILRVLAQDSQSVVRIRAAQNPRVPRDVLDQLCFDMSEEVRSIAVAQGMRCL